MGTQEKNIKITWWKLGLLTITTPVVYLAISSQFRLTQKANLYVMASEVKYDVLSIQKTTNVSDNLQEEHSKPFNSEKTDSTPTSAPQEQEGKDRLDFSDTGRAGQQSAGEARGRCNSTGFPLTALIPASNSGKTVKKYPTFWFYVPNYTDTVTEIEFVLQDKDRNHLWEQQISVNETSGYLNVSLPQDSPGLEAGKWYRWYFKVYCEEGKHYSPKTVYGWVTRITKDYSLESRLKHNQHPDYKVYSEAGIWFDAIDSLFKQNNIQYTKMNCSNFQKAWQQLMQARGVNLDLPKP